MKYFIICFFLILTAANQLYAQKNRVKLCLHDNPKLSPSYDLTYYWWDPYHILIDGKELDPDGVKKDHYLKTDPPYDYCFYLKPGLQSFKVLSIFNDSLSFELNLEKDTTLTFQHYVKDFYKIVPNSEKLLQTLEPGDKLTIHFAKTVNNSFEGLRIDMYVDNEGKAKITAINRKEVSQDKYPINYKIFYDAFGEIENAAELLSNPGETGFVITIRKNRLVKEFKGRNNSSKIASVYARLRSALNVKQ
jgi:hypothetical protein